jgi:signal transduction histidine kinase
MNLVISNYAKDLYEGFLAGGPGVGRFRDFAMGLNQEQKLLFIESRLEDARNIRTISYYSLIPLTFLSFVSGYLISGQMLKPLKDLNKEMENLSTKSLGKQIEYEDTGDEISGLVKSFNRMSNRLGISFKSQKEFVENASHELKTPLAVIQSNLDLALEDGKISKKELQGILEESRKSVKYMSKLTEDLLLLSALENDIEKDEVDIVRILQNCKKNLKTLAKEKDFNIKITGKKLLVIDGNDILLSRAFSNIIENSIKYSKGNELVINVRKDNEKKVIEFKDNGKGVPKKDLERIFDRFYRVDKSRSRKTGGSGIGLSITKKVIDMHNGNIFAENIKNGFRIVVEV